MELLDAADRDMYVRKGRSPRCSSGEQLLAATEMKILLDGEPDTLFTLFIKMASANPIDASLIAVMDKSSLLGTRGFPQVSACGKPLFGS